MSTLLEERIPPALLKKVQQLSKEDREKLIRMARPRIVEPYIKHIPHPVQQVFLNVMVEEAMYGGAAGGGKKSNIRSNVLTPKGWKRIGDVVAGDVLVDPRTGKSQKVIIAHPITTETVWEVEFEDGAVHECHNEHLWAVRLSGKRTKGWDSRRDIEENDAWLNGYKVVTTESLAEAVDRARLQNECGTRANYPHVPVPRAIEFTRPYRNIDATLPIDPYVLGCLLGDGGVTKAGRVWLCGVDDVVHDRFTKWARRTSVNKVTTKSEPGKGVDFRVSSVNDVALRKHFDNLGVTGKVSYSKSIPEDYLFAPLAWRYKLMRGLMDTDGYVDERGHMSYTTVSKQLADDVTHLARSLGAKVVVTSRIPIYRHEGKIKNGRRAYTVWITPHDPAGFVSVPRKRKRLKCSQNIPAREVVAVRKTDRTAQMRCITVDTTDGLYISDDFVVTHNSDALLMAALQYVDVPGYSALILRRTWPDLNAPGAILDRARTWLSDTPAKQKESGRIWEFPSGARLQFGYLQHDKDKYKFQSAEYQFIGFDELTHFEQGTYEYMFSRIRRPALNCLNCNTALRVYRNSNGSQYYKHVNKAGKKCRETFPDPKVLTQYPASQDGVSIFDVPLRMRSATNPGGIGHLWVKAHFIDPKTRKKGSVFVPARLIDNPSLDQESYEKNLMHLGAVDRERLLRGDWDVDEEGAMFQRHWFTVVDQPQYKPRETVRFWDLAATVNDNSDWTVGAKVSVNDEGQWVIDDIVRMQGRPSQVERAIMQTAMLDGIDVPIRMEQEPGSAGVNNIDNYQRNILRGFDFDGVKSTGSKEARAGVFSSAAEAGNVLMVKGRWNIDFLDEVCLFPNGAHDDQVDAVSGAINEIAFGARTRLLV